MAAIAIAIVDKTNKPTLKTTPLEIRLKEEAGGIRVNFMKTTHLRPLHNSNFASKANYATVSIFGIDYNILRHLFKEVYTDCDKEGQNNPKIRRKILLGIGSPS